MGPTLTLERNLNQSSRFLCAARRLENFIISLRLNHAEWRTFQKMKYRPKSPEKIPLRRVDVSFQAMNIRIGWNMKSAHKNNQWHRNWATTWNSISRVLMDGIWLGSFSPPPPPSYHSHPAPPRQPNLLRSSGISLMRINGSELKGRDYAAGDWKSIQVNWNVTTATAKPDFCYPWR